MYQITVHEKYDQHKGAGGMKLASDFKLPVSCFSSNLVNFSKMTIFGHNLAI